jgi:hypothetical protein
MIRPLEKGSGFGVQLKSVAGGGVEPVKAVGVNSNCQLLAGFGQFLMGVKLDDQ